jgi:hypothetical protein
MHLTHVGCRCNARFFYSVSREGGGWTLAGAPVQLRNSHPFDHKSEPVIDNGTENGNMLAAVVDSWANYRHASRVA